MVWNLHKWAHKNNLLTMFLSFWIDFLNDLNVLQEETKVRREKNERKNTQRQQIFVNVLICTHNVVFVCLFSNIHSESEWARCFTHSFFIIMEISRWSAASPCGINSLTRSQVYTCTGINMTAQIQIHPIVW